jgi:antitoxin ChpS
MIDRNAIKNISIMLLAWTDDSAPAPLDETQYRRSMSKASTEETAPMKVKVQILEDHAIIRLPKVVLEKAQLRIGDMLTVDVRSDGILLKPKRPRYCLDELIAECDSSAPNPDDLNEWINGKTIGNEVLPAH